MTTANFTTSILVDQTPAIAFKAINNVRGWWSEEIVGNTSNLNEEYTYHFKDVHICKMKLIEVIPEKKVVWLVLENHFNFTKDKSEWTGTKIQFEIFQKDNKTQILFTHIGLVPEYECFEICKNAWTQYIQESLFNLITKGKGNPNPIEAVVNEAALKAEQLDTRDYNAILMVDASAEEVFNCINNVKKWWTEDLEGSSNNLNDEFTVRFGDVHISTQKLVELIPENKIVWLVTKSKLNFVKNMQEWTNTKIRFEINKLHSKTQVSFTHIGLNADLECFNACIKGWDQYIKGSLLPLLTEGKGNPELK